MKVKCALCGQIEACEELHGYLVCQECFDLHSWAAGILKIHWEVTSGNGINGGILDHAVNSGNIENKVGPKENA